MRIRRIKMKCMAAALAAVFFLSACAASPGSGLPGNQPDGTWSPALPLINVFEETDTEAGNGVVMDFSAAASGVLSVRAENESRLKLQVVFGEKKYNYDLAGDGTALVVPLQSGDGDYTLRVLQNTVDDKYVEIFSAVRTVTLQNAFAPFLRASTMVNFTADSRVVKEARTLSENITNDAAFVAAVYAYLKDAIQYDYEFAQTNPLMYYPNPDETLESGRGICFDYAATAAAMLRSCGVPTKLVTGYATGEDLFHAWNMIYLEDKGWITVEISAQSDAWQIIDITMAATETDVPLSTYRKLDEY